ncbi:hypothetical protein GEMRC1_004229 [Eukaryota sp. GEM-RC1]
MSHSESPSKKIVRSTNDDLSMTHNDDVSAESFTSSLRFQQSLIILIHLHSLRRVLKSSLNVSQSYVHRSFLNLKESLPKFFEKLAYVSHSFFESALLAVTVCFKTSTFHTISRDFAPLCSFASRLGTEVKSVFLHVNGTFKVEDFFSFSDIISGLGLTINHHDQLEFLNKSSWHFPKLQQLDLIVDSDFNVSWPLIELLKVNSTITSINLRINHIRDFGARALAEALKVNVTIRSVDLRFNSIGAEGARALSEALKVNTTITSFNLGNNLIGDEGACALAEALQVNTTVTDVNLYGNSIGAEGAKALAEALKNNSHVKIRGIEQLNPN